ncbi:MAG: hypothetical protein AAFZ63_07185 [Bacteroidota bacterium]
MKHRTTFLLLFLTRLLIAQDQPALSAQIDTLVHQRMQQDQIPGLANCDYNEDFRQDILHSILSLLTE